MTRLQADSQLYLQQPAGHITASKFWQVVSYISVAYRSFTTFNFSYFINLLSRDVQGNVGCFSVYGWKHENMAREKYIGLYRKTHETFLSPSQDSFCTPITSFFGVIAAGIFNYSCCRVGVVEIKCPFCCIEISFEDATV